MKATIEGAAKRMIFPNTSTTDSYLPADVLRLLAVVLATAQVPTPYRSLHLEDGLRSFCPPQTPREFQTYIADSNGAITIIGAAWGKSRLAAYHLVVAATIRVSQGEKPSYRFAQAAKLLRDIRKARQRAPDPDFEKEAKNATLLVLDDVDKITRWDFPVFRELLVCRSNAGLKTIVTATDLSFLERADPQIQRRIKQGRQVVVDAPPLL